MADVKTILADPAFQRLPNSERLKVLDSVDPTFKGLPLQEKVKVLGINWNLAPPESKGYWSTLGSDIAAIPGGIYNAVTDPRAAMTGIDESLKAEQAKAADKFKQGHYVEAAGHGLAGLIPVLGPLAAQSGEEIGERNTGAGLAHATEALLPFAAKRLAAPVGKVARVAGKTAASVAETIPVKSAVGVISPRAGFALQTGEKLAKGASSVMDKLIKSIAAVNAEDRVAAAQAARAENPPTYKSWRDTPVPTEAAPPPPVEPIATALPSGRQAPPPGKIRQSAPTATAATDTSDLSPAAIAKARAIDASSAAKAKKMATAATADAAAFEGTLKNLGISREGLKSATQAQRNQLAKALHGRAGISEQTFSRFMKELGIE